MRYFVGPLDRLFQNLQYEQKNVFVQVIMKRMVNQFVVTARASLVVFEAMSLRCFCESVGAEIRVLGMMRQVAAGFRPATENARRPKILNKYNDVSQSADIDRQSGVKN